MAPQRTVMTRLDQAIIEAQGLANQRGTPVRLIEYNGQYYKQVPPFQIFGVMLAELKPNGRNDNV